MSFQFPDAAPVRVRLYGLSIRVVPLICTVPVQLHIGDGCVNDSWEDRFYWCAEWAGRRFLAGTPLEAARGVLDR